jgi:hypothetical protein
MPFPSGILRITFFLPTYILVSILCVVAISVRDYDCWLLTPYQFYTHIKIA